MQDTKLWQPCSHCPSCPIEKKKFWVCVQKLWSTGTQKKIPDTLCQQSIPAPVKAVYSVSEQWLYDKTSSCYNALGACAGVWSCNFKYTRTSVKTENYHMAGALYHVHTRNCLQPQGVSIKKLKSVFGAHAGSICGPVEVCGGNTEDKLSNMAFFRLLETPCSIHARHCQLLNPWHATTYLIDYPPPPPPSI